VTRAISGATRVAAVIGSPIRHSLSPTLMNAAFAAVDADWVYVAFDVAAGNAGAALDAMRALDLGGLSVTMPHKEDVAALVDELSPDADALGAVNCVRRAGAALVGENTDGPGFRDALGDIGFDPAGRRAAVLGAGGAARAVVLALARAGAAEVMVVSRTVAKSNRAAALAGEAGRVVAAGAIADADLVVNATPVGMLDEDTPFDPDLLRPDHVVIDLVYHPAVTPLLHAARRRGATAANGLGMLVHQAAHAVRHWTGVSPPVPRMLDAAHAALGERARNTD